MGYVYCPGQRPTWVNSGHITSIEVLVDNRSRINLTNGNSVITTLGSEEIIQRIAEASASEMEFFQ